MFDENIYSPVKDPWWESWNIEIPKQLELGMMANSNATGVSRAHSLAEKEGVEIEHNKKLLFELYRYISR